MRLKARQRGAGIVAAIAVIVLFALLGATLNQMFRSAASTSTEQRLSSDAFFYAEMGIDAGRLQLSAECPPGEPLPITINGNPGNGAYRAVIASDGADGYVISATGAIPSVDNATQARNLSLTVPSCPTLTSGTLFNDPSMWDDQSLIADTDGDGDQDLFFYKNNDEIESETVEPQTDGCPSGGCQLIFTFEADIVGSGTVGWVELTITLDDGTEVSCGDGGNNRINAIQDGQTRSCTLSQPIDPTQIAEVEIEGGGIGHAQTLEFENACLGTLSACTDTSGGVWPATVWLESYN